MANEEQKDAPAMHDAGDDDLWQELNRRLWLVVKEAKPSKFGQDLSFDLPAESLEAAHAVPVRDARKKECLSSVRCRKVAATPAGLTAGERTHLDDCDYCTRRINAFSRELLPAQTVGASAPESVHTPPPVQSVRVGLVEQISAFFSRPLFVGLSFAALVVLVGTLGFLVFRSSSDMADVKAPAHEPRVINVNGTGPVFVPPDAGNSPTVDTNPDRLPIESNSNANQPKKGGGSKVPDKAPPEHPDTVESPSSPVDLRGIPSAIHDFVRVVRNYSEIPVPEDVARMFKLLDVRGSKDEPQLLSPNRQVIVEAQPTFRWASDEGTTYHITVLNHEQDPIAHEEQLTGHSWVIPKRLAPGIYYWRIEVFDKDGVLSTSTKMDAIFKVVDKAEVERVKAENQSHLDKASYFIYVGLLNDAEIELKAELRDYPRSSKARKLLRQVRRWQKQLR